MLSWVDRRRNRDLKKLTADNNKKAKYPARVHPTKLQVSISGILFKTVQFVVLACSDLQVWLFHVPQDENVDTTLQSWHVKLLCLCSLASIISDFVQSIFHFICDMTASTMVMQVSDSV